MIFRLLVATLFISVVMPSQARAQCTNPTGTLGQIIFNEDEEVFQGCTSKGWWAFHEYPTHPCTGTTGDPAIGETCADGTIYAGLSPDGNVPMYTTPSDVPLLLAWNNGNSTGYSDTSVQNCSAPFTQSSCRTGRANTEILVSEDSDSVEAGVQPHQAAQYCYCMGKPTSGVCSSDPTSGANSYGNSDWYLPADEELNILYQNQSTIGGFPGFGPFYWSSSESSLGNARAERFGGGVFIDASKNTLTATFLVRCVRKGA